MEGALVPGSQKHFSYIYVPSMYEQICIKYFFVGDVQVR
jgi:hypothetical protein